MASSTFLVLTNKLLARFNEQQLTSGTFNGAAGVSLAAQQFVNLTCNDIYQANWEWPFNYVEQDLSNRIVMNVGQQYYQFPQTLSTTPAGNTGTTTPAGLIAEQIDLDNIWVIQDHTLTNPADAVQLVRVNHDVYKEGWQVNDLNAPATAPTSYNIPQYCFMRPDFVLGISPIPDQKYTMQVPYWYRPVEMVTYSDMPTIPSRFDDIIVTGAARYMHDLRKNIEQMDRAQKMFDMGILRMRKLLINVYNRFDSTMIVPNPIVITHV